MYKAQLQDIVEHQDDSKVALAAFRVRQLLYGDGSVYARRPTSAGAAAMSRASAQAWLRSTQRAPPSQPPSCLQCRVRRK